MTAPPRAGWLFLATLVLATAMGPMAMQLLVPSLPAVAADFEVPLALANLNISVAMVVIALSTLIYGPLSDRLGRRPVMLAGIGMFLTGTAISAFAPNVGMLIFGRAVQAVGGAAGLVVARAVVRDIYGPDRSASVIATLTVSMMAAPMIAVVLGGVFTDFFGWRFNFYFAFAVGAAVAALMATALRETRRGEPQTGSAALEMLHGYRHLFGSKVFAGYALQGSFGSGTFFAFMGAAPYVMVEILDRPATEFGVYFAMVTVVFMAANFVGGRLSLRFGTARMVLAGGIWSLVAALLGVIWLATGELGVFMLFATSGAISIGNGVAMPSTQAGALNVMPHYAGTASGAAAFIQTMMGAVFAQVSGSRVGGGAMPLFVTMLVATGIGFFFSTWPTLFRDRTPAAFVPHEAAGKD